MAGFVIHIAIAQEYLKKHPNTEKKEEFIQGVIAPDLVKDKSKTHYGKISSEVNLVWFLKENEVKNSYDRGYFLHLLTDCLFYNYYFHNLTQAIYEDYDRLNQSIIEKYKVEVNDIIREYAQYKQGEPVYLKREVVEKMIQEISQMKIDEVIQQIRNKGIILMEEEGRKYEYKC